MATQAAQKPIEKIECGDEVLCADPETGEYAYRTVTRTFVNQTEELTTVAVNGEQIESTPTHPYYVEGKGWVEASALHEGQTVWLADGTKTTVEAVSSRTLQEPVTVYNFEVEDFHTYFVGDCGVLVHNKCTNPGGRTGSLSHKNLINAEQQELNNAGIQTKAEVAVPPTTPTSGLQGYRFSDFAQYDSSGSVSIYHQVGITTKSGLPIQRESLAIMDIVTRTGKSVVFHSYNNPTLPPLVYMP